MLQALGRPKNPRRAMTEQSSAGSLVFNELGDTVSESDECCETHNPKNVLRSNGMDIIRFAFSSIQYCSF